MNAAEVLQRLHEFDTIVDARSEGEYALDHLPAAVNWPTLNDEERKNIGTLYKQVNAFEAKKRGAAMAARNIGMHIDNHVIDKPKDWRPLAYCWRGGKRSGALSLILDQIGFRVTLVEGGYKAFRAAMLLDIAERAPQLQLRVICGTTGSGKTRLLQSLRKAGAQVIDLEDLAKHRSSVLGALPGQPQPTQKHFDTLVWDAIRHCDRSQPIYIESESKKVGNLAVPTPLVEAMRSSPCINLVMSDPDRVALLMEDYDFFVQDTESFCARLEALSEIRGKAVIEQWQQSVRLGDIAPVVQDLLTQHYDPVYIQSMQRNFQQFASGMTWIPRNYTCEAMDEIAQELVSKSL